MKTKKMLGAIMLSAALAMGTVGSAFAAEAAVGNAPQTDGSKTTITDQVTKPADVNVSTDVKLLTTLADEEVVVPDPLPGSCQISVTVPVSFTVVTKAEGGALTVPTNYGITNYSKQKAAMTDIVEPSVYAEYDAPANFDNMLYVAEDGSVVKYLHDAEGVELDVAKLKLMTWYNSAPEAEDMAITVTPAKGTLSSYLKSEAEYKAEANTVKMTVNGWDVTSTFDKAAWEIAGTNVLFNLPIAGESGVFDISTDAQAIDLATIVYTISAEYTAQ